MQVLQFDIYSAENDIGDSIVVFSHDAEGDVQPIRKLKVTHRAHSLAVDEEKQELYVSVQYPPQVAVYRKLASGTTNPQFLGFLRRFSLRTLPSLQPTYGRAYSRIQLFRV